MKVVVQRVASSKVEIAGAINGEIGQGFLVLLGIGKEDVLDDVDYLVNKVSALRVFTDENEKMNLSLSDINGSVLLISQFTLFADTKKGNRPSFINAAEPSVAIPLYEAFISKLKEKQIPVETGVFGADMQVSLVNDGPVTIIIDSKMK